MKETGKFRKFIGYIKENFSDVDIESDNYKISKKEEEKIEQEELKQKNDKENLEKTEDIAKNNQEKTLLEKLEMIKEQLENEELTPFKRFKLQIKLSAIETLLDKQLSYISIQQFKEECKARKVDISESYNRQLELMNEEYEEIFDKKYTLEREIEALSTNIEERKNAYKKINNNVKLLIKNNKENNVYQYHVKPAILAELEEKQQQLEVIMNQKETKEEEMKKIQNELIEKQNQIDKNMKNQLVKYNSFTIGWNSIKNFFFRAKKDISEWMNNRKLEKEAQREAVRQAKINSKVEVRRKVTQIKNNENEAIVTNFRKELNSNISLEQQNAYTERVLEEDTKKEETNQEYVKREKAMEVYKERTQRLGGAKFEYRNGNYSPVVQENTEDEENSL